MTSAPCKIPFDPQHHVYHITSEDRYVDFIPASNEENDHALMNHLINAAGANVSSKVIRNTALEFESGQGNVLLRFRVLDGFGKMFEKIFGKRGMTFGKNV